MDSAAVLAAVWTSLSRISNIYSVDKLIDPSRVSDQELISNLTSICQSGKEYLEGHRLDNPGVCQDKLPSFLLLSQAEAPMESMKTDNGEWWQKNMCTIPNTSQGNSPNSPKFLGTKTTLQFKPAGAKKGVLGMARYNLLSTTENTDGLHLKEDLALCHVYPLEEKDKANRKGNGKRLRSGDAADQFKDFVPPPLGEWEQDISKVDVTEYCHIGTEDYPVDVPRLESKHWHNFTKIYTENPKLMYAACNHCHMMLKLTGGTSCGTGSLKRHNDTCRCKPKQEQLPGNSSSMPIPSIALQAITG
ncbi:hypothetical protein ACQJBY_020487 [Aegilops geniculata]